MEKISENIINERYKLYDIVSDENKNIGFIKASDIAYLPNDTQVVYSIEWLVINGDKSDRYYHNELTKHCNIFTKITACSWA